MASKKQSTSRKKPPPLIERAWLAAGNKTELAKRLELKDYDRMRLAVRRGFLPIGWAAKVEALNLCDEWGEILAADVEIEWRRLARKPGAESEAEKQVKLQKLIRAVERLEKDRKSRGRALKNSPPTPPLQEG